MNKIKLCTYIALYSLVNISFANASTDLINNVLAGSNNFLTEVGNLHKQYSANTTKYTSLKINPEIGDISIKLDKLEKAKEKAESLKEKAEKLQERYQTAVEFGADMAKKYEAFKAEAEAMLAEAQAAYAQYEELRDEYTSMYNDAKEYIPDKKDDDASTESDDADIEEALNQSDETQEDLPDAIPGLAEAMELVAKDNSSDAVSPDAPTPRSIENIQADVGGKTVSEFTEIEIQAPSTADTIIRANDLAENVVVEAPITSVSAIAELPVMKDVSVSDVISRKVTPVSEISAGISPKMQYSPLNFEEQLKQSTGKSLTIKPSNKVVPVSNQPAPNVLRKQFAPLTIETKEVANEK